MRSGWGWEPRHRGEEEQNEVVHREVRRSPEQRLIPPGGPEKLVVINIVIIIGSIA